MSSLEATAHVVLLMCQHYLVFVGCNSNKPLKIKITEYLEKADHIEYLNLKHLSF